MVKSLVAGTCWLLVMLPAPGQAPTEKEAIQKVLDDQVVAWNKGDLEGFMTGYWKSPQLSFFSGGTKMAGWQATLDRYKAHVANIAVVVPPGGKPGMPGEQLVTVGGDAQEPLFFPPFGRLSRIGKGNITMRRKIKIGIFRIGAIVGYTSIRTRFIHKLVCVEP